MKQPFLRFLLVGVANTIVGYLAILGFQFLVGLHAMVANALGYVTGISVSYLLNRRYTFQSQGSHYRDLPRFLAAGSACYLANLLVLAFLSYHPEWVGAALAQSVSVATYTVSFYFLNKRLVFRATQS